LKTREDALTSNSSAEPLTTDSEPTAEEFRAVSEEKVAEAEPLTSSDEVVEEQKEEEVVSPLVEESEQKEAVESEAKELDSVPVDSEANEEKATAKSLWQLKNQSPLPRDPFPPVKRLSKNKHQ